jgi:hypothetical protein
MRQHYGRVSAALAEKTKRPKPQWTLAWRRDADRQWDDAQAEMS